MSSKVPRFLDPSPNQADRCANKWSIIMIKDISLLLILGCYFAGTPLFASSSSGDDSNLFEQMFGKKQKPIEPDYVIDLSKEQGDIFSISDISVWEKKVILIKASGDSSVSISIPYDDYDIISNIGQISTTNTVNGKTSKTLEQRVRLMPRTEDSLVIPIKSNAYDGEFLLKVIPKEGSTIDIIAEIGFEKSVRAGTNLDSVKRRWGKPKMETVVFSNGIRVVQYSFSDYGITYELLVENNIVKEVKRHAQ